MKMLKQKEAKVWREVARDRVRQEVPALFRPVVLGTSNEVATARKLVCLLVYDTTQNLSQNSRTAVQNQQSGI